MKLLSWSNLYVIQNGVKKYMTLMLEQNIVCNCEKLVKR